MGGHKVTLRGPNLIKEISFAIVAGLAAGSVWKMNQWEGQRKRNKFYELLNKGEINVVHEE